MLLSFAYSILHYYCTFPGKSPATASHSPIAPTGGIRENDSVTSQTEAQSCRGVDSRYTNKHWGWNSWIVLRLATAGDAPLFCSVFHNERQPNRSNSIPLQEHKETRGEFWITALVRSLARPSVTGVALVELLFLLLVSRGFRGGGGKSIRITSPPELNNDDDKNGSNGMEKQPCNPHYRLLAALSPIAFYQWLCIFCTLAIFLLAG